MEYRTLGRAGLKLSALSYGSWVTFGTQVDETLAQGLIKAAFDKGVNFFDNAEVYAGGKSEIIMGKALKKLGFSRDSFCVSSKVLVGGKLPTQRGLSHKHVIDACHAALSRLQVDYLDLFYCHRPDPATSIEETVRAMHTLIMQGKILYWGTSEWNADQIQSAYGIARQFQLTPPAMEQPEYNLFERNKMEKEYLNLFKNEGLGATIWSPLASGLLTGKYNDEIPKETRLDVKGYEWLREKFESQEWKVKIAKVQKLAKLAKEAGIPMVNLALGWCLQNKNVSTIILGASKINQLEENLKTFDYLNQFTPDLLEKIDEIVGTKPSILTEFG